MKILRAIAAVVLGLLIGSVANMGLISIGPSVIPAPDGVDVTNAESIAASMHLFEPKHFLFPFLGHAVGTVIGAAAGYLIAGQYRTIVAYVVGAGFFAGGVAVAQMIPAPTWFTVTDLVVAYFPMAAIGAWIGAKMRPVSDGVGPID